MQMHFYRWVLGAGGSHAKSLLFEPAIKRSVKSLMDKFTLMLVGSRIEFSMSR